MLIVCLIVNSIPSLIKIICKDCENPWIIPIDAFYALLYWILITSVLCYSIANWANHYLGPSTTVAYSVIQPITAIVISELLIAFSFINRCNATHSNHCLYGADWNDFGAFGIIIGLYCILYSDRNKSQIIHLKQNQKKLNKFYKTNLNSSKYEMLNHTKSMQSLNSVNNDNDDTINQNDIDNEKNDTNNNHIDHLNFFENNDKNNNDNNNDNDNKQLIVPKIELSNPKQL